MTGDEIKIMTAGTVARMIRTEREKKCWSVYKLAIKSGVNASLIYRIEDGFNSMRIDTLQRLCAALEIEIKFPLAF